MEWLGAHDKMPPLTHYELHLKDPDLRTVQTSMAILIIQLFDGI